MTSSSECPYCSPRTFLPSLEVGDGQDVPLEPHLVVTLIGGNLLISSISTTSISTTSMSYDTSSGESVDTERQGHPPGRLQLCLRRPGRMDHVIYLDAFTLRLATAWEIQRHRRWPDSSNPRLFVTRNTAVDDSGLPSQCRRGPAALPTSRPACRPPARGPHSRRGAP